MVCLQLCELLTHTTLLKTPPQMNPADTDYATSGYDTGCTSLSSTVNEYIFENGILPAAVKLTYPSRKGGVMETVLL
jgi:hypothetical protein